MFGAFCQRAAARACFTAIAGLTLLGGCTGQSAQTASIFDGLLASPAQSEAPPSAPVARRPARGSCDNPAECKVVLKAMIDNPDRGWIGKPQPPSVYANGTRLFAYRALRKRLTCGELRMAVRELNAASQSLGGPVSGMTPDQVSRTRALSSEVRSELAEERAGRCRT